MSNPQIISATLDATHYWPGDTATLVVRANDPDARTILVTTTLDDQQGGVAAVTAALTLDRISLTQLISVPEAGWTGDPPSTGSDGVTTFTFRAVVPYVIKGFWPIRVTVSDQAGHTSTAEAGATVLRFSGDIGPDRLRIGSTTYMGSGATAQYSNGRVHLDTALNKKLGIERHYSTATGGALKRTGVNSIGASIDAGCLPFHSTKLGLPNNPTPAQVQAIVDGAKDVMIRDDARWCAAQGVPIWLSIFHEPEDNFATPELAALYRAMVRHVVAIYRAEEAYNVAFVHVTMCPYTYLVDGGEAKRGPWWQWDPDWLGTATGAGNTVGPADWHPDSVVDLIGPDQYCPEINSTKYRSFPDAIRPAMDRMRVAYRPARPWVVPEGGTKAVTDPAHPLPMPGSPGWQAYYNEMIDYMLLGVVGDAGHWPGVAYVVYNTDSNAMTNAPAAAERLAGLKACVEDSELAWRTN